MEGITVSWIRGRGQGRRERGIAGEQKVQSLYEDFTGG